MRQIKLGTAFMKGYFGPTGVAPSVVFNAPCDLTTTEVRTDGFSLSPDKATWRGIPFTLYRHLNGSYSLAVVIASTPPTCAVPYRRETLMASQGPAGLILCTSTANELATPASRSCFRGMPLALNSEGSLILTPVSVELAETVTFAINGRPFTAKRSGPYYALVISDVTAGQPA